MSREREIRKRDKVTSKMSRDGLLEHNAVTGEDNRVSKRTAHAILKGDKRSVDKDLRLDKRSLDEINLQKKRQKQRRINEHSTKSINAENPKEQHIHEETAQVENVSEASDFEPLQQTNMPSVIVPDIYDSEETHYNQPHEYQDRKPLKPRHIPIKKSAISETKITTEIPLQHEAENKLEFEREDNPLPTVKRGHKSIQRYEQGIFIESKDKVESVSNSAFKHDEPDKIHFESQVEENNPTNECITETVEITDCSNASTLVKPEPITAHYSEKINNPLVAEKSVPPLQPDKPSKLNFNESTPTAEQPKRADLRQQQRYQKAQSAADKSVKKLDTAKSKLPSKKKLKSERVFNDETGKAKRKLRFETEIKSQSEHLKGALPLRPVKAVGNTALVFGHRKMYQVEQENVATEAVHKSEMAAEGGARLALRHHKTAPYRKVQKLEQKVQKKSVKASYQKVLAENPKLRNNPVARSFQKQKIKRDYAKQARKNQKAAKQAGSVVNKATKAIVEVIKQHPVAAAVMILVVILVFSIMSLIGAFGSAASGGLGGILSSSYLAEDVDIDNAELFYSEWEVDLKEQIADTENTHSGYDEYRYHVDNISHDPFELLSYLTAKYQNYSYQNIETDLRALFNEQYLLTFTPSTETRYRRNADGNYEPYDWHVMTVKLVTKPFIDVAKDNLDEEQLAHFDTLMGANGLRQYLKNPFPGTSGASNTNWLSQVTDNYGYRIHPIIGEKNYHKGIDIAFPTGTPIMSGQDGTITFAGYNGDYGYVVVVESDKGLVSKYAHCDTLNVSVGDEIMAGDIIATVGNTGASTGPHVHIEIIKDGFYLNPLYFMKSD